MGAMWQLIVCGIFVYQVFKENLYKLAEIYYPYGLEIHFIEMRRHLFVVFPNPNKKSRTIED